MNTTREARGAKRAGQHVGGQFASNPKSEAGGAGLIPEALSETDNEAPVTEDALNELIEQFQLDYGNAESYLGDFMTVEAPQHATCQVDLDRVEARTMRDVKLAVAEQLENFDPDQEFEELWSKEFSAHNRVSAGRFYESLRQDAAHFQESAARLRGSADGMSTESVEAAIARDRAAAISDQVKSLRREHAASVRAELLHHVRDMHPEARQIVVIESPGDDNDYFYEAVGVLDEVGHAIDRTRHGVESDTSRIVYQGQESEAFAFTEADGEVEEMLGLQPRVFRDERMLIITLDESSAEA